MKPIPSPLNHNLYNHYQITLKSFSHMLHVSLRFINVPTSLSFVGKYTTGWWFGTEKNVFPYIGNFIIPTDEIIFFQRGRYTNNQIINGFKCYNTISIPLITLISGLHGASSVI